VRVQRRGAVRAHDPEILEAVVVPDAVDVVEDQRHAGAAPRLVLTAELADRRLDALAVETVLQMSA
jgi:hypothetical protein